MGVKLLNTQIVHDYSTDESVLRFHLDLPMNESQTRRMRQLLDAGDFMAAFELAAKLDGGPQNTELLTSFSNAMISLQSERTMGALR